MGNRRCKEKGGGEQKPRKKEKKENGEAVSLDILGESSALVAGTTRGVAGWRAGSSGRSGRSPDLFQSRMAFSAALVPHGLAHVVSACPLTALGRFSPRGLGGGDKSGRRGGGQWEENKLRKPSEIGTLQVRERVIEQSYFCPATLSFSRCPFIRHYLLCTVCMPLHFIRIAYIIHAYTTHMDKKPLPLVYIVQIQHPPPR